MLSQSPPPPLDKVTPPDVSGLEQEVRRSKERMRAIIFTRLSYPFRHYRQDCSVAPDKAVVGHTQITTTQLYLKSTNKLKKEAVSAIAL